MLLTAHGAARLLGTSERQIFRWVDDQEIPCRRVRDQLRFNPTDLLEWATGRQMAVHVEAFEDDDPRDRPPSLAAALAAGGVLAAIPATDRETVVRAIVARLTLPATFDRELLVEVMLAREANSVIAIDSIALPPARNPIIVAGTTPLVTVGYFANPVAFDGRSLRTMIVFVSPTVRCHLRLLARLSRALADREFRAAIDAQADVEVLVREATRVEALPPPEPVE
jgi:PTS system nitrogen regulatory IIA component